MMKFFALVALAMFATANATVATDLVLTRGTTLLGSVAGGDLIITFSTAAQLPTGNTITVTPDSNLFTADTAVTCTATPNTITGIAGASVGAVLTLTVTGTIAATTEAVITCTSNLANNAAAGTAVAVTMVTETDADTCTGTGYTTTSGVTSFTASRGTSLVTGVAPGDLVFGFTATTALAHSGTITLTSSHALFTASVDVACTAAVTGVATADVPTFVAADTESDATGKILTLKLAATATDVLAATGVITITCTDNMLVNDVAGAVTFSIGTTSSTGGDVGPLVGQTGYTITATQMCYTALTTATGDTDWASASTNTACNAGIQSCAFMKIVSSSATIYTMGCAPDSLPGTPPAVALTGCKVETAEPVSWIFYSISPADKTVAQVKAIVDPITTICPTSAASATAGVSMLTMLALAVVAMRQ